MQIDFLADAVIGPSIRIAGVLLAAFFGRMVLKRVINRIIKRVIVRSLGAHTPADDKQAAARAAIRGQTLAGVLKALTSTTIWVMAMVIVLSELGLDVAPLLAGMGIVGVALGFGAQNLVSDLVSGLFMLAEDQFGIGDTVEFDGTSGVVEAVGLRTTKLRAIDGRLWTVRNGDISRIANANKGWGRVVLDIGVAYDTDIKTASRVILAAAEEATRDESFAEQILEPPEVWGVNDLAADAVAIRLVCKTTGGSQWLVGRALRERIKEALDAEGIEIPFPQRTMWLRTDPSAQLAPTPFEQMKGPSEEPSETES